MLSGSSYLPLSAAACLRRRPEVRSQRSIVAAAAGRFAWGALCSFAVSAFTGACGSGGASVDAAGGGLNCANFGIFPVNLCSWSINSASSGNESTIFGSGLRSRPSSPCRSTKGAGAPFGASALTSGPAPFNHNASTRYCGVRRNEAGRLAGMGKIRWQSVWSLHRRAVLQNY